MSSSWEGPSPKVQSFANLDQASGAAARQIVQIAQECVTARGRFSLVLSGGSTPRRLYEILSQEPYSREIPWDRVIFFWGDERTVLPDHKDSNFRMVWEMLLRKVSVPKENIHRMPAEQGDLDKACRVYQTEMAKALGVPPEGSPPVLDLVLLGMGSDGHTASLFPHTKALQETDRWVVPNEVPQLETKRLTLTVPILNRAACVMFLVFGADKAKRLAEVLEGPRDPVRLPSQLISPSSGNLSWFLDSAATSELKKIKVRSPQ